MESKTFPLIWAEKQGVFFSHSAVNSAPLSLDGCLPYSTIAWRLYILFEGFFFFHKTAAKSASLSTLWSLRNVSLRATVPRCLKSSWPVERGRVRLLSGRRSPQFRRALVLLEVSLCLHRIMHFLEILLEWQITGNWGVLTVGRADSVSSVALAL